METFLRLEPAVVVRFESFQKSSLSDHPHITGHLYWQLEGPSVKTLEGDPLEIPKTVKYLEYGGLNPATPSKNTTFYPEALEASRGDGRIPRSREFSERGRSNQKEKVLV